jgi:hypothetical protein
VPLSSRPSAACADVAAPTTRSAFSVPIGVVRIGSSSFTARRRIRDVVQAITGACQPMWGYISSVFYYATREQLLPGMYQKNTASDQLQATREPVFSRLGDSNGVGVPYRLERMTEKAL